MIKNKDFAGAKRLLNGIKTDHTMSINGLYVDLLLADDTREVPYKEDYSRRLPTYEDDLKDAKCNVPKLKELPNVMQTFIIEWVKRGVYIADKNKNEQCGTFIVGRNYPYNDKLTLRTNCCKDYDAAWENLQLNVEFVTELLSLKEFSVFKLRNSGLSALKNYLSLIHI